MSVETLSKIEPAALRTLHGAGAEVRVHDLLADGFDPALRLVQHEKVQALEHGQVRRDQQDEEPRAPLEAAKRPA